MAQRGIVVFCLLLGVTVLGCSSEPTPPASVPSKLVGKIIFIQWGGVMDFAPSQVFQIHDADAATGMLCLSSYKDEKHRIWIHPSKFLSFTIATEEEANVYLENQAAEVRRLEMNEDKAKE